MKEIVDVGIKRGVTDFAMCGRYAFALQHNEIQLDEYNIDIGEWIDQDAFHPRYNIAPRTFAPVIRRNNDALVLHSMKFGLVPHWAKHEDSKLNTINARSENLVEGGGMWETMKRKKRCVVIAQGYYEWLKKGKDRIPHFVQHKDGKRLMLFAGLFDVAHLRGVEKPLWSFSIVTTSANKSFSWLHDRQPVILTSHKEIETWLDSSCTSWTTELTQLVEPYSAQSPLECYPVPKEVGKVGTQSPTFIQPISQRKDGIQAMFAKQQKSSSHSKRKRSSSPQEDRKKSKMDNESDSDIEIISNGQSRSSQDGQKMSFNSPQSTSRLKSKPTPSPKKVPKAESSPSLPKITDFST